nr:Ig-like domain-containing protein [Treponema sp.]
MQKLKKLFPLAGALFALAFVSCGSDSDSDSETATQQKTAGSISYATTSVEKTTADEAFTNALTKTGDGTVSYASSKTDVATVNATTGEVTIVGAGEATITATVADSESYTYAVKTASYTLTITQATYIGAKKPTEAKAVGDIVFTDGSATPYTADLTLTEEQKSKAVAVIFYAGSASDTLGAKTLGVGLKNATGGVNTLAWAENGVNGCGTDITAIQCTPIESESGGAATATFTGDLDGSNNWQALCDAVSDEETSGNYPAWEWVNAYATPTTANLTGNYASGWYLPTVAELSMLYRAKVTVNAALEKAGGMKIADAGYWSSSQYASSSYDAWHVWFSDGFLCNDNKTANYSVCTVRAF